MNDENNHQNFNFEDTLTQKKIIIIFEENNECLMQINLLRQFYSPYVVAGPRR